MHVVSRIGSRQCSSTRDDSSVSQLISNIGNSVKKGALAALLVARVALDSRSCISRSGFPNPLPPVPATRDVNDNGAFENFHDECLASEKELVDELRYI
jgi:hypothetical protein